MPTEKPKIIFVAEKELLKRIDGFRFSNHINSRSKAIRYLLDKALEINNIFPLTKTKELPEALKYGLNKSRRQPIQQSFFKPKELFESVKRIEKRVSLIGEDFPSINEGVKKALKEKSSKIVSAYMEGQTAKQIAEDFGIKERIVKIILDKASLASQELSQLKDGSKES